MVVFMSQKTQLKRAWTLASLRLSDAYSDFMLSRQANMLGCGTRVG